MGRYLSAYLCSSAANKTLRSFCKIRYLMILLRRCPRLCLRMHRTSPPAIRQSFLFTRKSGARNLNCADCIRSVRFYSSSGRKAVKAEAPVGIMEEAESDLTTVGGRLGQSFSRLSAHINFYFTGKDIAPVVVTPIDPGRSVSRQQKLPREDKDEHEISETASSSQGKAGLQLFHISSLATAFGESYIYVANHINSTFSRKFSQVPAEKNVEEAPALSGTPRKLKRRKWQLRIADAEAQRGQVQLDANQRTVTAHNPSSSWEEGYRQFARHINRYFAAKVADEPAQPAGERHPDATAQQRREEAVAAPPRGLFHHSRHATDFGENYFQTASHINQYFKGQSEMDEDADRDLTETETGSFTPKNSVSFMDCLRHPTSALPDLLGTYFSTGPLTQAGKQQPARTSTQTVLKKKVRFMLKAWLFSLSLESASSQRKWYSCFSAGKESQGGGGRDTGADRQPVTCFITTGCDRLPGGSEPTSHLSSCLQGHNVAGRSRAKLCLCLTRQSKCKDLSVCLSVQRRRRRWCYWGSDAPTETTRPSRAPWEKP